MSKTEDNPDMKVLKTSSCKTLSGKSTLTYQIGINPDSIIHLRITKNSGGGFHSNGIHSFIDQPDLAQRCLPLHLISIDEKDCRSESELIRKFQADLPRIFRGLLNLIADVMTHLPSVEVTNPERMIDFVQWLAAMEKVDGLPAGVYQMEYSEALKEVMLDSLMENPLAAAVMSFITESSKGGWSGTPTELLQELNFLAGKRSRYSREWPQTPSALSKRLSPLRAGLRRQSIEIEFGRGRHRNITLTNLEAF